MPLVQSPLRLRADSRNESHLRRALFEAGLVDPAPIQVGFPWIYVTRGMPASWSQRDFPNHLREALTPGSVCQLTIGRGLLVIDGSNEGLVHHDQAMASFHAVLRSVGIDSSGVVIVQGNRAFYPPYRAWCIKNQFKPVHSVIYNAACHRMAMAAARLPPQRFQAIHRGLDNAREKHFLCLNNLARPHRVALLLHLMRTGALGKGLVSMIDPLHNFNPGSIAWFPGAQELLSGLGELSQAVPLRIDSAEGLGVLNQLGPIDPYRKTYFSIVTETEFRCSSVARLTEKIFKPIAGLHPFVLLGPPGCLRFLRELGFQTFHPAIDETYDNVANSRVRAEMVLRQIDLLCSMPLPRLHETYHRLWPVVRHNYHHLTGVFTTDHMREIRLVSELIGIWRRLHGGGRATRFRRVIR